MNGHSQKTKYSIKIINDVHNKEYMSVMYVSDVDCLNYKSLTKKKLENENFFINTDNLIMVLKLLYLSNKYSDNFYIYKNDELILYEENAKNRRMVENL